MATTLRGTYLTNLEQREQRERVVVDAALRSRRRKQASIEDRRAMELRKAASVQRHIEQVRILRRDGSNRQFKYKPHERRQIDGIPKIFTDGQVRRLSPRIQTPESRPESGPNPAPDGALKCARVRSVGGESSPPAGDASSFGIHRLLAMPSTFGRAMRTSTSPRRCANGCTRTRAR